MSTSTYIHDFANAARDSRLQEVRPVLEIEVEVLDDVLAPIRQILENDADYGIYHTGLYHHLLELRRMCLDAQAAHTSGDAEISKDRNQLLNVLQGLVESAQNAEDGIIAVDYDDLYQLTVLADVIRGNADIYREYMRAPDIADALNRVADNIQVAQARKWQPTSDSKPGLTAA